MVRKTETWLVSDCLYLYITRYSPTLTILLGSMKTIYTMTKYCASSVLLLLAMTLLSNPVLAQAVDCGEADSNAKLQNYSLYYESYKNKGYASALPYLKWML